MTDSDLVVHVALVQLDDYGPWTTTPEPRRETDIQALQARLYADLADFAGARDGYAFSGRFDNMVAVTNGVQPAAYERLQARVRNRYPVTASVGVGRARTPVDALGIASDLLQATGSAQDADRSEILRIDGVTGDPRVTVAHFDVVDVTGGYTDREHAYDVQLAVFEAVQELSAYMRREHDSLSYFVGGDNVIAVCPALSTSALGDAVDHVCKATGVDLQVGVGRGPTAGDAGLDAKRALETCRETGARVGGPDPPVAGER